MVVRDVKKVYDLPGQKCDPAEERDPLRIFYESLSEQRPDSEMGAFWSVKDYSVTVAYVLCGVCVQSIEHPGCVWDAKFLENGDVFTTCSDGVIRIWTSHNDMIADPVDIEAFNSILYTCKCIRDLPYMQLGGIISPSIGKLSSLQRLALHQNSLHGFIPSEIANCKELRTMYLGANYLQGGIPPEHGKLSYLTIFALHQNSLHGFIPSEIVNCKELRTMYLGANLPQGGIPPEHGQRKVLH